jgi:hypothetical protein
LDAREAENFDAMIRKRAALSLYDLRAEQELQNALAAAQTLGRPDVIAVIQAQLDVLLGVAPPNTIQIDPPAQGIPVGESFQFQAFVRDSQGNLLQETLTWSSNNTAVATVVAGRVSGLTVGATTITASVPGTSATADVSVIPTPRRLSLMGGNLQGTSVGQALSQPLAVRLQDSTGTALSGVDVEWTVLEGGGSLAVTPAAGGARTDAAGRSEATWTLGTTAGSNRARANVLGSTAVVFRALAGVDPGLTVAVGQTSQTVTLVSNGTIDGTVRVEGQGLQGVQVAVNGPVNQTTTTVAGTGSFSFNVQAGTYTVTVTPPAGVVAFSISATSTSTGHTVQIDGAYLRNASVGGFLVRPDGRPIRNLGVTLSGPDIATARSGTSGEVLFQVRPGTYSVAVSDPGDFTFSPASASVTVASGQTRLVRIVSN